MLGDFQWQSVFVPDDAGLRNAFCFAVDRDWIIAWNCCVNGMLYDSWNLEGCKETQKRFTVSKSCQWFRFLFPTFSPLFILAANLIKLKVLFSVFSIFLSIHSLSPQSNYGFQASSVAKPTKNQMALNIKNGFQPRQARYPTGRAQKNCLIVKQDNIV